MHDRVTVILWRLSQVAREVWLWTAWKTREELNHCKVFVGCSRNLQNLSLKTCLFTPLWGHRRTAKQVHNQECFGKAICSLFLRWMFYWPSVLFSSTSPFLKSAVEPSAKNQAQTRFAYYLFSVPNDFFVAVSQSLDHQDTTFKPSKPEKKKSKRY